MKNQERHIHYDGEKDKEFILNSFRKCVTEKREMDQRLENLITPYIKTKNLKILDACCGIGHISYFLNEISPESFFMELIKLLI